MDHTTTYLNKLLLKCDDDDAMREDRKCFIYSQSKWSDDCVEFVLHETKSNKCYKGKLSKDEIQESATELEVAYDEFLAEILCALTANIAASGFEYEIDEAESLFKLTKKLEFDIQYVEVKLREVRNNFEMLDTAIELVRGEQKACSQKIETEVRSDQNFQELKEAFEKVVQEKNTIEKKILKKCAMLLNSKKEKIAKLQEKLEKRNGVDSEEAEDDVEMENSRKPAVVACKRNKETTANTSNGDDDAKAAGEKEDDDFMAATQQMTQLDDDTTIELMPKRSRHQLRILDETTDDL